MKCDQCKQNEATFFYEENINGKTRTLHLCHACKEQLQKSGEISSVLEESPLSLLGGGYENLLDGLFGIAPLPSSAPTKRCTCGASLAQLAKSGKVCCPSCYDTFAEELTPTIRSLHGNVTHTGRAPAKRRAANEKKHQLKALRDELKEAVKAENFERAATLRDQIRALEQTGEV